MLCELKVENLALIESLHLVFERAGEGSLVVMTGETGAGKSIMMRAIGLLTGARGSADWIRSGAGSCSVEALFEINEQHRTLLDLLDESGFGRDTQLVIKRTIGANGRSRLYVNGSMATARSVTDIGYRMLNIASQHDHQRLLQPSLHLDFLDTLGDHWDERARFKELHDGWSQARDYLVELVGSEREREQRLDFLSFQVSEISGVAPEIGEDEQLAAERKRLKNAASLIRLSRESHDLLASSITDNLAQIRKNVEQLLELDPGFTELGEELSSYSFLAEDYSGRLRRYCDGLENDPMRLEIVNERLDQLQGLKRKYGDTLQEVLAHLADAQHEIDRMEHLDKEIEQQRILTESRERELMEAAGVLSLQRRETAQKMELAMGEELKTLAFSSASIEVRFTEPGNGPESLGPTGADQVEFFFAPNPGEPARPLAKVASGGELSRLMLALKCLLARRDMVETVIFDEVDAGVGGEAAEAVARKIKELAQHHQVLCITHLPQIAARGTQHLRVEKDVIDGRTTTSVIPLTQPDRVDELARMLAGDSATEQTHAWAEALLEKGRKAA